MSHDFFSSSPLNRSNGDESIHPLTEKISFEEPSISFSPTIIKKSTDSKVLKNISESDSELVGKEFEKNSKIIERTAEKNDMKNLKLTQKVRVLLLES